MLPLHSNVSVRPVSSRRCVQFSQSPYPPRWSSPDRRGETSTETLIVSGSNTRFCGTAVKMMSCVLAIADVPRPCLGERVGVFGPQRGRVHALHKGRVAALAPEGPFDGQVDRLAEAGDRDLDGQGGAALRLVQVDEVGEAEIKLNRHPDDAEDAQRAAAAQVAAQRGHQLVTVERLLLHLEVDAG